MCCRHTPSSSWICLGSALHSPLCQWSSWWIRRLKRSKRYKTSTPVQYLSSFCVFHLFPPSCPSSYSPSSFPVPHYFPQFLPCSSVPCLMCPFHSLLSCPGSMVPFFIFCSCLPHSVFIPSTYFSLYFFLPFFDRTKMQSTNKCHLALTTGAKDWDSPWHSQEMSASKTVLGSCKPCKRLSMNTLLRGSRGCKLAKFRWILTRKAQTLPQLPHQTVPILMNKTVQEHF